jgi:PAS domain S-box-containing protein
MFIAHSSSLRSGMARRSQKTFAELAGRYDECLQAPSSTRTLPKIRCIGQHFEATKMATGDSDRIHDPSKRYETLQVALHLIDQGLTVFDADLRLVAWNNTFLRLLDFPPELAYFGAPFESFMRYNADRGEYGSEDPDRSVAERVAAARTFLPHQFERTRPNGRVLLVRGEPLPGHGFVTLYSDVTDQRYYEGRIRRQNAELEERVLERTAELRASNQRLLEASETNKQIASALRRSEERLRLITDTIPALIGYFDRQCEYQYANRGYHDWFGVAQDEMTGRSIASVLGAEAFATVKPYIARALTGEQVTFEYEVGLRDGRKAQARTSLVPERSVDGQVTGCFELTFDISEQKRTQAALVQAQRREAIGQLAGGMAHDFNNILTVVVGNLSALCDERPGDADVTEYVEPALVAARRGAELIKGLLAYSRQHPLEPRAVDVGSLVQRIGKLVHRSLPENFRLDLDVPPEPVLAMVDMHELENALLNLLFNARDAMPSGGAIHVAASLQAVDESAGAGLQLSPGFYVRIDVIDEGVGMDDRTIARAFEPFFTTKGVGQGSGLGMSLVYGFVKQSGGSVSLDSRPRGGTTVSMLLPRAEEGALQEPELVQDTEPLPFRRVGIALLVEDDAQVRRVVRRHLIGIGYAVIEAADGAEGRQILDSVPDIQLVLTDVVMPGGVDGRELARYAHEQRHIAQVMLMSGYAAGQIEMPGIPLLPKPFTKAQLAAALASIAEVPSS